MRILAAVIAATGYALIVVGVSLYSAPAGLIAAGVALLAALSVDVGERQ